MSQVEVVGRPLKQELERAIMKTDFHDIRRLVAQQTYEILWWLRHVRSVGTLAVRGGASSSNDDFGRFWMKPDGPVTEKAILGEPCDQCIDRESATWYGSFCLRSHPAVSRTVSGSNNDIPFRRLAATLTMILTRYSCEPLHRRTGMIRTRRRNGSGGFWLSFKTRNEISCTTPSWNCWFRYRILCVIATNESTSRCSTSCSGARRPALLYTSLSERRSRSLMSQSFQTQRHWKRSWKRANKDETNAGWRRMTSVSGKMELDSNARIAAEKLGLRDTVNAFPDVLRLSPWVAALMAAKHPDLKPKLVEYLQPLISDRSPGTIAIIWRADLREFTSWLEELASAAPPHGQNGRPSDADDAKTVLLSWRETDALTKTKLDIMLTGKIGGGYPIPEVLRAEFDKLSNEDKAAIRNFVSWMRTIEVPWLRQYLENVFTPHTPHPDNPMER